jgi:prepilin-type N-terminal cleavage/methylation domain-containing protein
MSRNDARMAARRGAAPAPIAHRPRGFTLLEVLVALAVLAVTLLAVHNGFTSTLFVNSSTRGLWKAIVYANTELLRWERLGRAPVSLDQGEFRPDDPMAGYAWRREIEDVEPFPGVRVRRIRLELTWDVGGRVQSYRAETYVEPK